MKMFVKVCVCVRSVALRSLSLLQCMMHFEIPLKTSVFDTRRLKESVCMCKKETERITLVFSSIESADILYNIHHCG